jgi:lysophospholipase L1-like esterase
MPRLFAVKTTPMRSPHAFSRLLTLVSSLAFGLLGTLAACSDSESPGPMSAAGSAGQPQAGTSGSASAGAAGSSGANTAGNTSGGSSGASAGGSGGAAGSTGAAGSAGAAGSGGAAGGGGSGGSAGSAGSGGSGGQAPYNPCPTNGDPCRVLPLGDSITHLGGQEDGAYRVDLFKLSLSNNKKLTFVGSHESGPQMVDGVSFPRHHEGHSGWTIADGGGRDGLYDQIQGWLMTTPPDIVALMIGTNDTDLQLDLPNAPMRLGLLLDRIAMYAPNALTVVAQIVPSTDDALNQRIQAYNAAIPALVKARADAGKHVIMVDMYTAFTTNPNYKTAYMGDKLHPKAEGLVVMANTWWAAIGALLPPK